MNPSLIKRVVPHLVLLALAVFAYLQAGYRGGWDALEILVQVEQFGGSGKSVGALGEELER